MRSKSDFLLNDTGTFFQICALNWLTLKPRMCDWIPIRFCFRCNRKFSFLAIVQPSRSVSKSLVIRVFRSRYFVEVGSYLGFSSFLIQSGLSSSSSFEFRKIKCFGFPMFFVFGAFVVVRFSSMGLEYPIVILFELESQNCYSI